jgi:hypothetical protein
MAIKLPEPPEWWTKYKPLRWLLAALVLYWMFGTLLPRFRTESPPPAAEPVEVPAAATAPETAETVPPEPAAATPPPKPVEPVAPKPAPAPPPAARPEPPPVPSPAPVPSAQAEPETPDPKAAYTQVEAQRVRMMDALRSYDSVATLQAQLAQGGYAAELATIERKPPSYRYPPYRNDTLTVAKYRHEAYEGRLTLEFFNDRLYQAYFVPAQPADYLRWLRGRGVALPVKRTGRSSLTQGQLRITTNIDFASSEVGRAMPSSPFVLWEDLRLVQQMQDWGPVP